VIIIILKKTDRTTAVKALDNQYNKIKLEDVPIYIEESTGEELVMFADVLKSDEQRIAKKYGIGEYNIFEIALLYADVKQRKMGIRQKFRFNKMLFYLKKRLEEEYGEDVLIFDEMGIARAGPIPIHLKEDIKQLKKEEIIEISIIKDGKRIPGSKENWEKYKSQGSIECILTKKGEEIAQLIWRDLDPEMREIIVSVKEDLFYMDTETLKNKVHREYPEYKKNYTENDNETFVDYLSIEV